MASRAFPASVHYQGLNAPVRMEVDIRDLAVEGELPAEIAGAFFRAVPDPAHPPMLGEDDNVLSGDGMVGRFLIQDGHVDYATRYVRTARFEAERNARRSLFGKYRNPFTDDPSVAGVDRTVANTTPIWHAGRLYMTKEDGRAYRIDPHTLETIGRWDFDGALKSETMTAHARIDPETNEMFAFGYEAGGLASEDISYFIVGPDGKLTSEQWFKAPYCALVHDFVVTEQYAIFPLFPTIARLDRLKEGGAHWVHEQEQPSWIGVMPRYGKVEEMVWIEGPAGVHAFHFMNAFDDGGVIRHRAAPEPGAQQPQPLDDRPGGADDRDARGGPARRPADDREEGSCPALQPRLVHHLRSAPGSADPRGPGRDRVQHPVADRAWQRPRRGARPRAGPRDQRAGPRRLVAARPRRLAARGGRRGDGRRLPVGAVGDRGGRDRQGSDRQGARAPADAAAGPRLVGARRRTRGGRRRPMNAGPATTGARSGRNRIAKPFVSLPEHAAAHSQSPLPA